MKRIFRAALTGFWRNTIVSLSGVLMMVLTLFVISTVLLSTAMLQSSLDEIKKKVDVNVYFERIASEEDIRVVEGALKNMPEVAYVEYISAEQALTEFKENYAGNEAVLRALDAVGENPLGGSLNVKAVDPANYKVVADYLSANYPEGASIVKKVNYNENKLAIDRLIEMISAGKVLGAAIALIYILISIVIVFNTIRLTIYIARDEIGVMRLVGATPAYVRGPFIVAGALYGLVAALVTLIILIPLTWWLGPFTYRFFAQTSVFDYFLSNMWIIGLVLLAAGIFMGAVSSALAVRRYLR